MSGRQYIVTEQSITIFPTRSGTLNIEPASVNISDTSIGSGQILQTEPVQLQVQPLPDGAPDSFNGAVGQFDMMIELSTEIVDINTPITLQMRVIGSGNIEQIPQPALSLPEIWRVYEGSAGEIRSNGVFTEKVFEWSLIPEQPGIHTLPAIVFSYFDPLSAIYRSVASAPVEIDVQGTANAIEPVATVVPPLVPGEFLSIKPVPATISYGNSQPDIYFWALWAIPPVVVALGWVWASLSQRTGSNQARRRQSKALQQARSRLRTAAKSPKNEAYQHINRAIFTYFGDKLGQPPASMNMADLQKTMKKRRINPALREQVLSCLEWAEEGRFAPNSSENVKPLIVQTNDVLTALDAEWETR